MTESLKSLIPTVGVPLEEEEFQRLMDVIYAFNLEEAQSACVLPRASKLSFQRSVCIFSLFL